MLCPHSLSHQSPTSLMVENCYVIFISLLVKYKKFDKEFVFPPNSRRTIKPRLTNFSLMTKAIDMVKTTLVFFLWKSKL